MMGFKETPDLRRMAEAGQLIDQLTGRPLGESVPARKDPLSVLSGVLKRVQIAPPPSTNNLFLTSGRKRVQTPEYRAWLAQVVPELSKLERPAVFPVAVVLTLVGRPPKINMRRDVGNIEKACGDALVKAGVIPDDCLKYVTRCVQQYRTSDDGPGVWVEVFPDA